MNHSRFDHMRRFAPEFQLALACAHWPLRTQDQIEIRRLVSEPLEWKWFIRIIERNQILPLVYHNLRNCLSSDCHAEVLRAIRTTAVGYTGHSMAQAAELVRVTESVKNAGFEIVALKGVSLAILAYGNLAIRSPGDIDLLVSGAEVFDVERILRSLGYSRLEPRTEFTPKRLEYYLRYYKHFTYLSEANSTPIELHWRLFHNIPLLQEADAKFPPTTPVEIGSSVVYTLPRHELFLYLCVHGAIHGWPILKWLADIGALLSAMDNDDISEIAELAKQRGLVAEFRAALKLADLFLAVEASTVEFPSEANPVTERIVAMAQRLLTAKDYCLEVQRLPRLAMFFYDLRLRSSWRYRSEDIRRALVHPPDWDWINLPDALFPLYAVFRPVSWLFRHSPGLSRRRSGISHHAPLPPDSSTRRDLDI
jgi:Uncharacterised nucleotidyltransferase